MVNNNNHLKFNIKKIESEIDDPSIGLPDDIFYFVGRVTPFINVDLLISVPDKGILLTWRDDEFTGSGWHFPGGIIRFREKIVDRVKAVALNEINIEIESAHGPLVLNEIFSNHKERSHFISLLYQCSLSEEELHKLENNILGNKEINFFKYKPDNLLKWHEIYKDYFEKVKE